MKAKGAVGTPAEYIAAIEDPARRADIAAIDVLIRETVPDLAPHVDGAMLGYGRYRYRYPTGNGGEAAVVGLASNVRYISLYLLGADDRGYVAERYAPRFPKASIGKSCIRFKRLSDVDVEALRDALSENLALMRALEARGDGGVTLL